VARGLARWWCWCSLYMRRVVQTRTMLLTRQRSQVLALNYWHPSTTGTPQLLAPLSYWHPSTTGTPQLLAPLNYWHPSTTGTPQLLAL